MCWIGSFSNGVKHASSDSVSMADEEASFKKMKLLADDETGRVRTTVAGHLMCAPRPEKWLPGAFSQAVRYRGSRQDSNY